MQGIAWINVFEHLRVNKHVKKSDKLLSEFINQTTLCFRFFPKLEASSVSHRKNIKGKWF